MKYTCRYCKHKFELSELSSRIPQVCKSKGCIFKHFKEYKDKILLKAKNKAKENIEKKERQQKKEVKHDKTYWRNKADKWFSIYIRIKYRDGIAGGEVYCRCFVRPHILKPATQMDNGHCFSRSHLLLRYEPDNCRPQNRSGNRWQGSSETPIFMKKLEAELGAERWGRLLRLKNETGKGDLQFYQEIAQKYYAKINELQGELGFRKWW